jgi:type III secretory pathway component EscU
MEIFGLELNEFIFSIFLPLILFYLILFVFLKRSNIFGNVGNLYYSLTALTISSISIFSLYSFGLTKVLPYLAAALTVLVFVSLYLLGILKYSTDVITGKERLKKLKEDVERLTKELEAEKDERKRQEIKKAIREKISEAESLAKTIGINIDGEEWYKKAREKVV